MGAQYTWQNMVTHSQVLDTRCERVGGCYAAQHRGPVEELVVGKEGEPHVDLELGGGLGG